MFSWAPAAVVAVKVALLLMFRRWHLRWRATDTEVDAALPGDDLLPAADLTATRAIAIDAPAREVWPWLAQLGQGRGGLYSYDFLENAVARCDIHSVDRIVPEWQQIAAGDQVRIHPKVPLDVAIAEPDRALVLRGGAPDGEPPAPYDFTWAFVLQPRTRRHDPTGDAGAVLLQQPLGTADGGAHRHRQLRDEPEDVARHQGSGGTQARFGRRRCLTAVHPPEASVRRLSTIETPDAAAEQDMPRPLEHADGAETSPISRHVTSIKRAPPSRKSPRTRHSAPFC